ncbi:MAG: LptF/LptG family permease [Rhodobacter sp.]|nr:LptF/LptG family permease [Rhodobacter sp.]
MTALRSYPIARLRSALFGIATRRAVTDYLKMIVLISFLLLMIAWTIDLAEHFPSLRRAAGESGTPLLSLALPYLGHRAVDILARMLPIACFFGVFLAEIVRRERLETVVLVTSGASPWRMFAAVLWVGLFTGAVLDGLEARWRPAAVWTQVETGFGDYARRFRQDWLQGEHWFVSGDTALRGEVLRADPPEMRNVLVFVGIRAPRLKAIYAAERMVPGREPIQWTLLDGYAWELQQNGQSLEFEDFPITLELLPQNLTYLGVPEFYLPQDALLWLDALPNYRNAAKVDVALWRRMTVWLAAVSFAFLGVVLAQAGYTGRQMMIARLIGLAAMGYSAVVSLKVFWALGELGVLSAPLATLGAPVLGLAIAWVFLRKMA